MSRVENESRSSRAATDQNGGRPESFRILRLYSIEKKDPKKPGPPKKTLQLVLEHLSPDVSSQVREQIESQLRPQQALEIDGVIVAKGSDVGQEDVESLPELKGGDMGEAYQFAHRMLWEIYERETAALDRLTERSTELFKRNLDLTLQLQRAVEDTLELQSALRAIFEGETIKKEHPTAGQTPEDEGVFNARNVKNWASGIGGFGDFLREMSKLTKTIKNFNDSQAAGTTGP